MPTASGTKIRAAFALAGSEELDEFGEEMIG